MFPGRYPFLSALAALLIGASPAGAQPFEQAGVRALGLGGAFVGVADDASAIWWNPAGLASGPFFNAILERQSRRRESSTDLPSLERSALDQTITGFALATPPLGLSYYRTRYTVAPAAAIGAGRTPERGGVVSLVAHQTGITVLHSITSGLVIGSTLKFVRGIVATGLEEEPQTEAILDRAADLIGRATNRFDADFGVHLNSGAVRAGVTLRNASEPAFKAADGEEFVLERQARAGVAVVLVATTVAADLDLTSEREDPAGRRAAIGVEQRLMSRMALRAGLRVATGDQKDRVGSIGGSVAVRTGIWVDAFWSRGDHKDTRWGVAARMAY